MFLIWSFLDDLKALIGTTQQCENIGNIVHKTF